MPMPPAAAVDAFPGDPLQDAWRQRLAEQEGPIARRRDPREALTVPLGGMLSFAPAAGGCGDCERVDVLDRSADGFCLLLAPGGHEPQPGERAAFELANASGHFDAPRAVIVRWVELKPWATAVGVQWADALTPAADPP